MSPRNNDAKGLDFAVGKGDDAPMKATCQTCGEAFEAVRSSARYCSGRCRQAAHIEQTHPEGRRPRGRPRKTVQDKRPPKPMGRPKKTRTMPDPATAPERLRAAIRFARERSD